MNLSLSAYRSFTPSCVCAAAVLCFCSCRPNCRPTLDEPAKPEPNASGTESASISGWNSSDSRLGTDRVVSFGRCPVFGGAVCIQFDRCERSPYLKSITFGRSKKNS